MGNTLCSSHNNVGLEGYHYDEDLLQDQINHKDQIKCKDKELLKTILEYSGRLRQSKRLFKDPVVTSQPFELTYQEGKQEIRCTFERPSLFIDDPSYLTTKKFKIFQNQDKIFRKESRIKINNNMFQYFGVFLCFIAQNIDLLHQIILTDENSYGLHAVKTYQHNEAISVVIDQLTPCYKNRPFFTEPIDRAYIWPCLLEKTWLKIQRNQKNVLIRNYHPLQVYQHFLKYPTKTFYLQAGQPHSKEKDTLQQENNKQIVQTLVNMKEGMGCFLVSRKNPAFNIGLKKGRYYYFLTNLQYKGTNIFYLRNPCGHFDFRGCHSVLDSNLQEKLKTKLNVSKLSDSDFLLQEEEFIEQIEALNIIYYQPDLPFLIEQHLILQNNQAKYVQFQIQKDCILNISFVQQEQYNQKYFPVSYQIIDANHCQIVEGYKNQEGCFGMKDISLIQNVYKPFNKGTYILRIKQKDSHHSEYEKVVNNQMCSQKLIFISSLPIKVNLNLQYQRKRMINVVQSLFFKALKTFLGRQYDVKIEAETIGYNSFVIEIDHLIEWIGDLVVIYIRKMDKKSLQQLKAEVYFPQMINLQCISHKINKTYTKIQLADAQTLIVLEKIDLTQETLLGKYDIQSFQ